MEIHLRKVKPDYFTISDKEVSKVWQQDISIIKGEHLHIVAPSGSGKTSLILFIYGLRKDYSGAILYGAANIKEFSTEDFSAFRQNKISVIFQDLRLFENQTARENIEIKRILNPYHKPEAIDRMAKKLGIENKLNQQVKICSYGEQQRIAIIRALMQPFDFLLLDEPYSHLDEENKNKAMALIREECDQRNAAMVFADLKPLDFFKRDKIVHL
ncbi:MAG: ATP-binding cassette domain-containing protein [Ginsengibacter sp.]